MYLNAHASRLKFECLRVTFTKKISLTRRELFHAIVGRDSRVNRKIPDGHVGESP